MNHSTPTQMIDTAGNTHMIEITSHGIMLDGKPCQINVKETQIVLMAEATARGIITLAPAALWHAFVGNDPTPEAAGLLLAEMLARHGAMQEIAELALCVRPLLDEIERHIQEHRELILPTYHFDAFTFQLLHTYDGTEEHIAALAHLLKQPSETILAWLTRVGLIPLSAPAPANTKQEEATLPGERQHEATPGDAHPKAPDASEKRQMFRWTPAMIQQLNETFFAWDEPNISAAAKAIAQRYGWPAESVEYKIYHLDLPRQRERRHQQDTETSAEQEEEGQPVIAVGAGVSRPIETSAEQEEGQPEEAGGSAIVLESVDDSCHLSSGNFLWDVKIDGKLQHWPLDVAYGMFPFSRPGTPIVYHEQEYVLQQVSTSVIVLTPVGTASAGTQEHRTAMQLATV